MRNPSFSSFSLFSNPPPTHPRQVASYKKQAEELYKAANPDANIDDPNEDDWEGRPTSESPFVPAPPPLTEPAEADLDPGPVLEGEEGDIER